ncbi:MAG: glycosyltransferase family 2 protein [PVC group bacterium]
MKIVFLLSVLFIGYTYLGYPLVLFFAGRRQRPTTPVPPAAGCPSVSLLIPVYNEEAVIEKKLENALRLDYPPEKLEIVVAADGCSDRTVERVRPYLSRGVRLLEYAGHRGKMAAINRSVPRLSGEIVVFTDASVVFPKDALTFLLPGFSDPSVGTVSGALVLKEEKEAGGELPVDWYWRLEKFVRERESRWYSCISATGAIYAIRRELISELPEDTILDDLLIPLGPLRRGYRILFEGRAVAYEEGYAGLAMEFRRKVRTLAGNYQSFARASWALLPGKSPVAFQMISHKLFRLLVPFALLGMLLAAAAGPTALRPFLCLQVLFYGLAGGGLLLTRRGRRPGKIFSVPLVFCLLNGAALKAFFVYFFQRKNPVWR